MRRIILKIHKFLRVRNINYTDGRPVDGEAIEDGVRDILVLHQFDHFGDDGIAAEIVIAERFDGSFVGREEFADAIAAFGGEEGFVGFLVGEDTI